MIQANSLLFNFQMKSPCYLVTLSLESSDFQTFLKQYVILVPLILSKCKQCPNVKDSMSQMNIVLTETYKY